MASRSHFAAPLLLAVFVGLIVYVSLYPFRVVPHQPTMIEALHLLTWARASHSDMFNNLLLYLPFGFCGALLIEPRFGRVAGIVAATIAGAALSTCMELLQASIAPRVPSLTDLSLNTLGTLAGAILGSAWHMLGASMTPQTDPRSRSRAVALLVVVLWLLTRLWPLIPDPGLRQLKAAVRPLLSPRADLAELGAFLLGWLVVAQSVFHLARRQRAVDVLLIVIAVVLVGRTFTAGNTLVTAEVAAIALLLPVLVLLSRVGDVARAAVVAALLAAWFAWIAVAPLLKGSAGMSGHVPALAEFIARNPPSVVQLAGKAFSYVALGWLLASAGLLPHVAAGVTFLLVVLLTLLQLSAPAPAFGWVDVLIAGAAAVVVARWMPNSRGHSAFRKK